MKTYKFKAMIKVKKVNHVFEFNQPQWLKRKEKKQKKNGDKDEKALYNLINNVAYSKTIKNVRNRIDVKPVRKAI